MITTLDQDVAVAVLDDSIDGWYKVNYNGNVGYVSADYLVIDQDNVFTSYGRVSGDGVNVRSAPSTSGGTLATVNDGAMVTVNGLWTAGTMSPVNTVRRDISAAISWC